jgi:PKD repeat protein
VKGKVEDKMLRDLFRQKLEGAEIIPSTEAGVKLMRQVGRKEFLRFNPTHFNIWYAGGIAVAGAALAVILTSPVHKKNISGLLNTSTSEDKSLQKPDEIQSAGKYFELKVQSPLKEIGKIPKKVVRTNNVASAEKTQSSKPGPSIAPAGGIASFNGKEIFKRGNSVTDNLRSQNLIAENIASASVTEGCAPLKVSFMNNVVNYDSCRWTFGDGGSSSEKNPKWLFDIPGEYTVTLSVSGTGKLHSSSSLTVIVHTAPKARFEFSPENAVLPNDEISFHNYSSDAIKYRWDFGDGSSSELFEPMHSYKKSGRYNLKLTVSTEFGCSDSVIVKNAFSGSDNYIEFPNAFIPNLNGPSTGYYSPKSDEASQVFHPVSSTLSDYQLRIFSRSGIIIFESNDINIGWDGYYKGHLCDPGVYIWKVRGNYLNGEPFTKMGDVTLLKN